MNFFIQFLTNSRIICGPIIFLVALIFENYSLCLLLFFYAAISDFLDGYLARKYNLASDLGVIFDPIADKILTLFLILTFTLIYQSAYIAFVGGIILLREFWVGGLRNLNAERRRENATSVTFLAKTKTTIQFLAFGGYLISLSFNNAFIGFLADIFLMTALILTIQTGLAYTVSTFQNPKK
jgi:CDP-diacylglycerol---glycerol-3-phosphate 3-phosphatidyltransferase